MERRSSVTTPFSEMRRPVTPERRARIDAIKAEQDAKLAKRKIALGIRLSQPLVEWLRRTAEREERTISSIVEDALQGVRDPHH